MVQFSKVFHSSSTMFTTKTILGLPLPKQIRICIALFLLVNAIFIKKIKPMSTGVDLQSKHLISINKLLLK